MMKFPAVMAEMMLEHHETNRTGGRKARLFDLPEESLNQALLNQTVLLVNTCNKASSLLQSISANSSYAARQNENVSRLETQIAGRFERGYDWNRDLAAGMGVTIHQAYRTALFLLNDHFSTIEEADSALQKAEEVEWMRKSSQERKILLPNVLNDAPCDEETAVYCSGMYRGAMVLPEMITLRKMVIQTEEALSERSVSEISDEKDERVLLKGKQVNDYDKNFYRELTDALQKGMDEKITSKAIRRRIYGMGRRKLLNLFDGDPDQAFRYLCSVLGNRFYDRKLFWYLIPEETILQYVHKEENQDA